MDPREVEQWFAEYVEAFAACGRGESPVASLLDHYGVPLLVTTDDGVVPLATGDEVLAMVQRQVDGMREAGYHHTDVLDLESSVLNSVTALCRGTFSRHRSDGSEIGRLTATYLVTGAADGRRISTLVVHAQR